MQPQDHRKWFGKEGLSGHAGGRNGAGVSVLGAPADKPAASTGSQSRFKVDQKDEVDVGTKRANRRKSI
jgi:hypothetical protein